MKRVLLFLIRLYKRFISPLLLPACRFYPTCSSYAYTVIERFGAVKGSYLAARRLLRCNPSCNGGVDYPPLVDSSKSTINNRQ